MLSCIITKEDGEELSRTASPSLHPCLFVGTQDDTVPLVITFSCKHLYTKRRGNHQQFKEADFEGLNFVSVANKQIDY